MDARHFDNLTRAVARGATRRGLLRGLGAGLAAALLGRARAEAAPSCRGAGKLCTQHANCCSGICDPATRKCVCPQGQIVCKGTCVLPCEFGFELNQQTCVCEAICDPGLAYCPPDCADLAIDENHCGVCDNGCNQGATCCGGNCIAPCGDGFELNLGTCACEAVCDPGLTLCNGQCVNTETSSNHCGACGSVCNANGPCGAQSCIDGDCVPTEDSCGSCSHCDGLQCVPDTNGTPCGEYGSGFTCCMGECTNTKLDISDCGACGNNCPAEAICDNGFCRPAGCFHFFDDCAGNGDCCSQNCSELLDVCVFFADGEECNQDWQCRNGHCSFIQNPPICFCVADGNACVTNRDCCSWACQGGTCAVP